MPSLRHPNHAVVMIIDGALPPFIPTCAYPAAAGIPLGSVQGFSKVCAHISEESTTFAPGASAVRRIATHHLGSPSLYLLLLLDDSTEVAAE